MSSNKVNTHGYLTMDNHSYMFAGMNTETLADRLKLAMKEAGMSQAQLAEAVGIAQPSIFKILSGKSQNSGYIVHLSKALGVRPEWLALNEGPMRKSHESNYDAPYPPPQTPDVKFVHIWKAEEKTKDLQAIPKELNAESCRAFFLDHDSGFPEATLNSVVVVDVNEQPKVHDYVFACVHGSYSVYKFLPGDEGGFLSPSDPRASLLKVGETAKIIGVVVYISKKFNR
ncbi:helix-turn-helix domain-containing protein [Pantoea ananatis]|uniref:helix-turn-helix domain-containing protein n=1 Tax=Pantoea ananas TaxID=553 RepID=UPI001B30E828|nr:helix-turn-helix domain-containing protein [Pantoea ananatis]